MLLNKSISLNDIEAVDPNLFTSLKWMLENSITDIIDTTFSVEHDSFGVIKVGKYNLYVLHITNIFEGP